MVNFENILAIETSQQMCSVALLTDGKRDYLVDAQARMHSRRLLPMIESLLKKQQIDLATLDVIALSVGPGSFTGLRVGASIAQGLAFANQLQILPISSLDIIAYAAHKKYPQHSQIVCSVDARMDSLYWAQYKASGNEDVLLCLNKPQINAISDVDDLHMRLEGKALVVGSGANLFVGGGTGDKLLTKHMEIDINIEPNADDLLYIARQYNVDNAVDPQQVQPIYLRGAEAWKAVSHSV